MFKKALIIASSLALSAFADETIVEVESNSGTNTATSTVIIGFIEDITIDVVTAGSTADVSVVTSPSLSTLTGVTLVNATALDTDTTYYTRFDGTDATGTALTTDDPWKFYCNNQVILSVSGASATGRTFKAVIKTSK